MSSHLGNRLVLSFNHHPMTRVIRSLAFVAIAFSSWLPLKAQLPTSVDIGLQHDAGNQLLRVSLRANDLAFSSLLSNLVFTVRWQESSAATLAFGSGAWCPPPSVSFPMSASAAVTPGNGYHYRTWTAIGLASLGDLVDDGGCEQSLPADAWVEVYAIPVNNDPGGTIFEIADDAYANDNNRGYFVSLEGIDRTGGIFSFSTEVMEAAPAQAMDVILQPNPANAFTTLVCSDATSSAAWIEVIASDGRTVMSLSAWRSGTTLDISALETGAYRVRISDGTRIQVQPLIVAR